MSSKTIKRNEKSLFSTGEFAPEFTKERVTTLIDEDVVDWMRAEAKRTGIGYQTFMNVQLRSLMNASKKGHRPKGFSFVEMESPNSELDWTPAFTEKLDSVIELKVHQIIKAGNRQTAKSESRAPMKARKK